MSSSNSEASNDSSLDVGKGGVNSESAGADSASGSNQNSDTLKVTKDTLPSDGKLQSILFYNYFYYYLESLKF